MSEIKSSKCKILKLKHVLRKKIPFVPNTILKNIKNFLFQNMNKNEQLIIFNTSKYEPYLSKKSLRNEIEILRDELQLLKTQIQLYHKTFEQNQDLAVL